MLTNSDYQLTLTVSNDGGKDSNNVFYFKGVSGVLTAEDLNDAFNSVFVPLVAGIISTSSAIVKIESLSLLNVADFDLKATPLQGQRGGEYLSDSTVWAYELLRPTRAIRHSGRKAFGRVSETDVVNGAINTGVGQTITQPIEDLRAALQSLFFDPTGTGAYRLCLPRSTKGEGLGEDPAKYYLRELHVVDTVLYKRVSTQNSRKNW